MIIEIGKNLAITCIAIALMAINYLIVKIAIQKKGK